MRKNIEKVIAAFRRGESAIGDSKRTCHTDGRTVYSYDMPIAERRDNNVVWVITLYSAPTATTRLQVRALEESFPYAPRIDAICRKYTFRRIER